MESTSDNTVSVVIPTFRPPREVVTTVASLADSGINVLISDDASPATSDLLLSELAQIPHVTVMRHFRNAGIARGLNDGLHWTTTPWLLTLDQDSHIGPDYIPRALAFLQEHNNNDKDNKHLGACGAEVIQDTSGPITYPTRQRDGLTVTEELIQSGTFWNVAALRAAGGFNEQLAMDAVDAAACLALRQRNFIIAVIPGLEFKHHLGNATQTTLFGRTIVQTNHGAARRKSMITNRLALFPQEFRQSPKHALRTLRRVAVDTAFFLVRPPRP